eukprot:TRINITY_DN11972_c0_g1_i1.p1 TRINITY_DN11972_c0_g1~~TRINITY_DN11972_c0_g1_i1.p1  ORF type:complete len:218 (+),score=7.64 TRINITY_DN11972_c0_g1_i1:35-655(+)
MVSVLPTLRSRLQIANPFPAPVLLLAARRVLFKFLQPANDCLSVHTVRAFVTAVGLSVDWGTLGKVSGVAEGLVTFTDFNSLLASLPLVSFSYDATDGLRVLWNFAHPHGPVDGASYRRFLRRLDITVLEASSHDDVARTFDTVQAAFAGWPAALQEILSTLGAILRPAPAVPPQRPPPPSASERGSPVRSPSDGGDEWLQHRREW